MADFRTLLNGGLSKRVAGIRSHTHGTHIQKMPEGGNSPMTGRRVSKMLRENIESLNALQIPRTNRPNLVTQQSSSLPSTPYVHARELSDYQRIPSPIVKAAETTSPRSARSESDSTLRPPGKTPFLTGCKYETGMAYSRRRIPYSLGGDKLEPSLTKVKKRLEAMEEERLSRDMQELYSQILPSSESDDRRAKFVAKLERILNGRWPGNNIKVHVFGSSGNLLCTSDSDVDICITTPMRALERVCLLAKALAEHGMQKVVCVPQAKVPIVKIWDPELELACDMNVNNTLALENTRMIRTYVQIDPRVRPLAMIVKHWTRRRILNDAALGGTLSSYTWICLIINFLQTRNPKILPSLQQRPHQRLFDPRGKLSSFADDIKTLQGFGDANKETLGELLFFFFRRYGHEIDFDKHAISVREGGLIPKQAKTWHLMQNNRLCVEEPFNTDRNLGNTADDISFRGVHQELRRAFDLISQAKLDQCCEQFVFPPNEEKFWIKPVPQPRPTLTRSLSQSSRSGKAGGMTSKGNNPNHKHRTGTSNRRASSAAAMNKVQMHPAGQQGAHLPAGERPAGNDIHEQLYQHYQLLQAQEAQLRLQMHQRSQANLHAQMTAQLHPLQMAPNAYPQQTPSDGSRRSIHMDSTPLSAPLRHLQRYYYSLQAPNQPVSIHSLTPSLPNSQSGTNPPSPSMVAVQPSSSELRRSIRRVMNNDNNASTMRSHSQPPESFRYQSQPMRAVPPNEYNPSLQGHMLGYTSLQQYQQAYLQERRAAEMHRPSDRRGELPYAGPLFMDSTSDERVPRQYVGYFFDQSSQPHPGDHNTLVPPIPLYADLTRRTRGTSPNSSRANYNTSRSPSPSHSTESRERSVSFYSAMSTASPSQSGRASVNGIVPQSSGPVIVDGSTDTADYTTPPEPISFSTNRTSRVVPVSGDQESSTPVNAHVLPVQEHVESISTIPDAQRRTTNSLPSILQFGDFPLEAPIRTSHSRGIEESRSPEKAPLVPVQDTTSHVDHPNGLADISPASSKSKEAAPPTASSSHPSMPSPSTVVGLNLASTVKSLPLLSPVREVRTPSPTATRGSNGSAVEALKKASHGRSSSLSTENKPHSSLEKAPDASQNGKSKASESAENKGSGLVNGNRTKNAQQPQPPPPPSQQVQVSGWQQSTNKKNKKNRKAGSVGSAPLIVGDGERKGG